MIRVEKSEVFKRRGRSLDITGTSAQLSERSDTGGEIHNKTPPVCSCGLISADLKVLYMRTEEYTGTCHIQQYKVDTVGDMNAIEIKQSHALHLQATPDCHFILIH